MDLSMGAIWEKCIRLIILHTGCIIFMCINSWLGIGHIMVSVNIAVVYTLRLHIVYQLWVWACDEFANNNYLQNGRSIYNVTLACKATYTIKIISKTTTRRRPIERWRCTPGNLHHICLPYANNMCVCKYCCIVYIIYT